MNFSNFAVISFNLNRNRIYQDYCQKSHRTIIICPSFQKQGPIHFALDGHQSLIKFFLIHNATLLSYLLHIISREYRNLFTGIFKENQSIYDGWSLKSPYYTGFISYCLQSCYCMRIRVSSSEILDLVPLIYLLFQNTADLQNTSFPIFKANCTQSLNSILKSNFVTDLFAVNF